MDYKLKDELGYERNLADELKQEIQNNALMIQDLDELQDIEFMNEFDIEELLISQCLNVIPKLSNPRIRVLNFYFCRIKYLNELKLPNLEALTVFGDLDEQDTVILQNFGDFKKLQQLMIRCYQNLDLKLIPVLQLSVLGLTDCNLKNIEQLTQFTKLDVLNLPQNPNIDIRPLAQMVQLTELNLEGCRLKNVNSLRSLDQLKDLCISNNDKVNIHALQYLKQLTSLNLGYCSIIDLTYLMPLINLKQLNVTKNNIVYLKPLKVLKCITFLNATYNKIKDISILHNHLNFNQYLMNNQLQVNEQDIIFANKLRDINAQITLLRQIRQLNSSLKNQISLNKDNTNVYLQHMLCNLTQFTGQVVSLFQQLLVVQDAQ
ncbi:leucine-rich_repeat domain-containing protein [Hexamita inflata]|uniref:Leucine-rich repeat domain-containing protein n=1 Tax=Hexamita inflata TaxID=28002 RepID=A0AA86NUF5_9EUKA|nr:leucine-rich repeat domain-containing protein [Hexamita inflata]